MSCGGNAIQNAQVEAKLQALQAHQMRLLVTLPGSRQVHLLQRRFFTRVELHFWPLSRQDLVAGLQCSQNDQLRYSIRRLHEGQIQGWAEPEEAVPTPFSLKFCTIFIEFSKRQKVSIQLASGQLSRPPLSELSGSAPLYITICLFRNSGTPI